MIDLAIRFLVGLTSLLLCRKIGEGGSGKAPLLDRNTFSHFVYYLLLQDQALCNIKASRSGSFWAPFITSSPQFPEGELCLIIEEEKVSVLRAAVAQWLKCSITGYFC